ncbi:MAG TPA: PEGA domain-containing protein [Thermoanaerobaculia bacterium]|jgi:hypothetical protein|nr:PEGA domain-containing protein [Thermoanaerobaculia bacterium]
MTTQKPTAERRLRRAVPFAAAALLLASLPAAAQQRTRPSESGDSGWATREAHPAPTYQSPGAPNTPSAPNSPGQTSYASSPPRTAHPTGPSGGSQPHRQPPSRGDRGSSGGHHHSSGGYYPYHYPYGYGNFGFWGWWWGGGWGGGYYPYYYPYGYGYGYGYGEPGYRNGDRAGALDFDVSPDRTQVYIDGEYVGKVDAFDGWPRYLWLPKGTYDVVLYLDGYKTVARQITVYPGSVLDIDDRLEPGESVRPEDLASKSHDRRDERLRYERERRDRIDRGDHGDRDDREDQGDDDADDWRDRVRHDRMRDRDDRDRDGHDVAEDGAGSRKGRLVLEVDPDDASVYLDGRFVGTGSELALMRGGLPVTPGEHRLAVVRPGRKAEEREFEVKAGEEVELEVELETDSR